MPSEKLPFGCCDLNTCHIMDFSKHRRTGECKTLGLSGDIDITGNCVRSENTTSGAVTKHIPVNIVRGKRPSFV